MIGNSTTKMIVGGVAVAVVTASFSYDLASVAANGSYPLVLNNPFFNATSLISNPSNVTIPTSTILANTPEMLGTVLGMATTGGNYTMHFLAESASEMGRVLYKNWVKDAFSLCKESARYMLGGVGLKWLEKVIFEPGKTLLPPKKNDTLATLVDKLDDLQNQGKSVNVFALDNTVVIENGEVAECVKQFQKNKVTQLNAAAKTNTAAKTNAKATNTSKNNKNNTNTVKRKK